MTMLSVVVVSKNEEANIGRCLDSVKWADEIIVVDAGSTDGTLEIAKRYTDRVFVRHDPEGKEGLAELNKNFGMGQANYEWILVLDADEVVPHELKAEIRGILKQDNGFDGYLVLRKNHFIRRWMRHGDWWGYARNVELVRRGKGYFPPRAHQPLEVNGKVGRLNNAVIHNNYKEISEWMEKANVYTSLEVKGGNGFNLGRMILYPPAMFVRNFILKAGFRDGFHGFIAAVLAAVYAFVKQAKLWEKSLGGSVNLSVGGPLHQPPIFLKNSPPSKGGRG